MWIRDCEVCGEENCHQECGAEAEKIDKSFGNLLAVIHRDGGHYTEAAGSLEVSASDAGVKCITLVAAVENFYMDFKARHPGEVVACPYIAAMFAAYNDINKQFIEYGNRDRSNDLAAPDIHVFVEADDGRD